ncbi:hypothetical protein K505DRAFT_358283 [Melanomma pulvis-pyrius CBS 109.77]|uniref:Uncharacterized protein n=1 Tax=Melanomma pulvis-pyrius CBS 109.77 TaxID=1314802 RepID=A0A6A6XNR9_9PLEO|nr:hypothetical protein K505DRAFT_358283 [Melanomma pulvis-pyrius CBS 109.77]
MFYLDESNLIKEHKWAGTDAATFQGNRGRISNETFTAHPSSKLSTYWPWIMYQYTDKILRRIGWNGGWTDEATNLMSPVSLVPIEQHLPKTVQLDDSRVGAYTKYGPTGQFVDDFFPSFTIPFNASLVAFTTSNANVADKLEIYLIYQDASENIQMCWCKAQGMFYLL